VSNTGSYAASDFTDDITKAQAAGIDGFALNIAVGDPTNTDGTLDKIFAASNSLGSSFKLFLSFDYAANGLWKQVDVITYVQKYASNAAYFHRGSQPLVSTFEGPAASADWPTIKSTTGCFFIPSWSSLGAAPAWALGTADGLFSW
jgi:Glycosyl hydrolase family 71